VNSFAALVCVYFECLTSAKSNKIVSFFVSFWF